MCKKCKYVNFKNISRLMCGNSVYLLLNHFDILLFRNGDRLYIHNLYCLLKYLCIHFLPS